MKLVQRSAGRSGVQAVDRWIPDQPPLGHRATCIVGIAGNIRIGQHARHAHWKSSLRSDGWIVLVSLEASVGRLSPAIASRAERDISGGGNGRIVELHPCAGGAIADQAAYAQLAGRVDDAVDVARARVQACWEM